MAAPGVAGRDEGRRLAVVHELGGHAQRGVALAPQRLRGALGHADDLGGVADLEAEALGAQARDLALDGRPVADEDDGGAELPGGGHRALDDDGGAVVASHGVDGDLHGRAASRSATPLRRRRSPGPCSTRSAGRRGAAAWSRGTAGTPTRVGRGELVVRAALAPARLASGVVSAAACEVLSSQRSWKSRGQVLEGGQARVGRPRSRTRTATTLRLPPHTGHRPRQSVAAQRLHGQRERRLGLDRRAPRSSSSLCVEVEVEIVGGPARRCRRCAGRGTSRTSTRGVTSTRKRLQAAAARLRHRRPELAAHERRRRRPASTCERDGARAARSGSVRAAPSAATSSIAEPSSSSSDTRMIMTPTLAGSNCLRVSLVNKEFFTKPAQYIGGGAASQGI